MLFFVNTFSASNAAEWHVIEDSSNVRFIYSLEGAAFRGRFDLFSAKIDFDTDNPSDGKIVGVVKMESTNSGDIEIVEMDRMRKIIAKHMILSKSTSAHVTSFVESDVSKIVECKLRDYRTVAS